MSVFTYVAQYTNDLYYTTSTSSSDVSAAALLPILLFSLALSVFLIVCLWKVYQKAGKPGWASIVPVYNTWVMFEIVGYPGWWALLSFIPLVNIFPAVMMLVAYFKLAKLFGKSDGFAVCTILFPVITLPILAFGKAQFQNAAPVAGSTQAPVAPAAPLPVTEPQAPVMTQAPVAEPAPLQPQAPAQPTTPSDTTPTPPQPPVVQ